MFWCFCCFRLSARDVLRDNKPHLRKLSVSIKTAENSTQLGRRARQRFEPSTSRLRALVAEVLFESFVLYFIFKHGNIIKTEEIF